jgi:signal transduction histidine kinase
MSVPIRTRLSLSFLAVLLLGMGLAAGLAWFTVEKLYLDTQWENLLAQARLTAEALRGEDLTALAAEPYSQTTNVLPGIHTHILEGQDALVLTLPLNSSAMSRWIPQYETSRSASVEALLRRSEIDSALQGTPAAAVRRVAATGNARVLYAAAPVYSQGGQVQGIVYLAMPLPAGGLPAAVLLRLAGFLLLALLLALAAAALISRRIARPIESIARAADQVAAGDLGHQVSPDASIRELGSLAGSFNAMTASLQQADQAKTAFLADVTHELRTPLTVIKGTIETLEDGALDDAEGRGPLLASMQNETERLIRLVNDLLVLTRADAGALKLSLQPVDLAELAHSRCRVLAPLAREHQVDLQVEAEGTALVLGDPDRLAQVLDNLLDNAIRHSPVGAAVTVRLHPDGREIQCSVQDKGSGIPAAHLSLIFERFYRVETSRDRQSGGNGLGLAIVRALVLAQHGQVQAESVEGQGATITFRLPAASRLPEN